MKILWVLCIICPLVGVYLGHTMAQSQYYSSENRFGPFGRAGVSSEQAMAELFDAAEAAGTARAEVVGGSEYNFGVMLRNAKAKHEFEIRNVGTGRLRLVVKGSSCKCTVGSLNKEALEPGESTTVLLEWEAKTTTRTFSQTATLGSNDPSQSEIQLRVHGDVVELMAADPPAWNLSEVAGTSELKLNTTLYNHSTDPVEISEARWLSEDFQQRAQIVTNRREVNPAEESVHAAAIEAFDVEVTVPAPIPQGALSQTLRIKYRSINGVNDAESEHPPLDLPLTGEVVGDLSVMGGKRLFVTRSGEAQLSVGQVEKGTVGEQKVYVIFRGPLRNEAKLKVGAIEPAEVLEAEFGEPTERGSMVQYPLVVRTKADAPEMERAGQNDDDFGYVTVESDHPDVVPYRIRVMFRIGNPFGN